MSTPPTDPLVVFLAARLAEDERWARAASTTDMGITTPGGTHWQWVDHDTDQVITPHPEAAAGSNLANDDGESPDLTLRTIEGFDTSTRFEPQSCAVVYADQVAEGAAGHIVRHDPARVLRDVAVKRSMLDEYETEQRFIDRGHAGQWAEGAQHARRSILAALAAVYADHPDHRQEWKP